MSGLQSPADHQLPDRRPGQRVIHGGPQQLPEHELRVIQARERARWELGDPSWADTIIAAYCDPNTDATDLQKEMDD